MAYKRILTIQDISCLGQCSMTVALPVLSACGHETCILPTAVLSTHTGGFGRPQVRHLADMIEGVRSHWQENDITFDAILVGYLGSIAAIEAVSELADTMLAPDGKLIVDPAMADHGKLYSGFDEDYARAMQKLCEKAHIMIPNITEAAMMTGMPFREAYDESYIQELLSRFQGREVVLTGVSVSEGKTGVAVSSENGLTVYQHDRVGKSYHGTGDLFAAAFTGSLMQGKSKQESVEIAAKFVCKAIENTEKSPAHWYGVKFETAIPGLIRTLFG